MFKFLRKYNKLILVVGGVLLMITFLIPDAIQRFSQQAGARSGTVATLGEGNRVSAFELDRAGREAEMLRRIGWSFPGLGVIDNREQWYLLAREADQAGLVAPAASLSDQDLMMVATASGERDRQFLLQTVAKAEGVGKLLELFATSGLYSDRRLEHFAQREFHVVTGTPVVIQADASKVLEEPSEEELQQQFETYKDKNPGEGEMGFGYRLPDRFKLEWLHIPASAVRASMEQSEQFAGDKQRLHWRRNPDATFPAVESNAAVPDVVKQDLLNRITQQRLEEIAKYAADQLRLNRRGLPERDGSVVLPEDWHSRMLSFPALAQDLQAKFNIGLPEYHAAGDSWMTLTDLDAIEGLSAATTDRFGEPLNARTLISNAQEFGRTSTVPTQVNVAGPPLRTPDGSVFIFRLTAADKAREPQSLDEVRNEVATDLKRLTHYNQLAQSVDAVKSEAVQQGLLPLAMMHDTVVQIPVSVFLSNPFSIQQTFQQGQLPMPNTTRLPIIGQHRPTSEAVVEYALSLPQDVPASNLPMDQRVFVTPVKDRLALLVMQINSQLPLTSEVYSDMVSKGLVQYVLAQSESQDDATLRDAFSLDALAARHNYKPVRGEGEETEPQDAPEPTSAAQAG